MQDKHSYNKMYKQLFNNRITNYKFIYQITVKKFIMTAMALIVGAVAMNAQSFKVYTNDGKIVGFNTADVRSIEFSDDNLGETIDPNACIPFSERFESVNPAAGTVDLTKNPLGLGRIEVNMRGTYMYNNKFEGHVSIAGPSGTIYDRAGVEGDGMHVYLNVMGNTTQFVYVVNPDGYTQAGDYTLTIPDGFYRSTEGDGLLGGTTFTFTIEAPAPAQTITVNPAEGVVEKLETFTVMFNNYSKVELASANSIVFLYKDGTSTPQGYMVPTITTDGRILLALSAAITTPGTYSVDIAAGMFKLTDEVSGKSVTNDQIKLVYQIEGAELAAPRVGDFYYSDGTWSTSLIKREGVTPIGVVFYVGEGFGDKASFYTTKDGGKMTDFHGYVIALHDATYYDGSHHTVTWTPNPWDDLGAKGCGCSTSDVDFLGYTNTKSIINTAEKSYGGALNEYNFPATYYATTAFEAAVPAPAQSSGWFLPSPYQLQYIWDRVYFTPNGGDENSVCIEKSLKALAEFGGAVMYARDSSYWTSVEQVDSYGHYYRSMYVAFDSALIDPGFTAWSNKDKNHRVRSVLAF